MIAIPEFMVPENVAAAVDAQKAMREKLVLENQHGEIRSIAGVDVGYDRARNIAHASIVLLTFPELELIEQVEGEAAAEFPYVPGLLSFREIPAILAALRQLRTKPDLLMVDGQGIAHPRRLGIAAHLGALLDMPSIGVAKSRLTGSYGTLENKKFAHVKLMYKGEQIGVVMQSKLGCKPLFISPGHRVDIARAAEITQQCITRYRLPEPTRIADKFSKVKIDHTK